MDVVPDVASVVIPGSAVGAFVYLVVRMMHWASGDRTNYQTMERNLREQHSRETEALNIQHKAELEDCRNQRDKLHAQLDETRAKLWKAQDAAARYRQQMESRP